MSTGFAKEDSSVDGADMAREQHDASVPNRLETEIIAHGLESIAHEMALTVANCAISQVVRDSLDFSTAVFDSQGNTLAQGLAIPLHLGAMPDALQRIIREYGDDVRPGDVYILNDPDEGGMHLPDVFAFRPVIEQAGAERRTPQLWLGCVAHHSDMGGRFPGSNAVDGEHIYEEGLQIPPMRVVRGGVFDANVRRVLQRNVRLPNIVWTDISAQLAALATAETRAKLLLGRFGAGTVAAAVEDHAARTFEYVKRLIRELPDGAWSFRDYIDGDIEGLPDEGVVIQCTLTIEGDRATFDLAGSSQQVPVAINSTESFTRAAVLTGFIATFDAPELRLNQGLYNALDIRVPAGTVLAADRPAPRAARGITGFRALDCVLGALAQVVPDRVMAAGDGGPTMMSIGTSGTDGKERVLVDFLCGAWGARSHADGLDGASALGANLANVPIEELEAYFPVRYRSYGLVQDSGGTGEYRGGLGSKREFEFLGESGTLSIRSDRRDHRPYGLFGGGPGAPSSTWHYRQGREPQLLPTKGTWKLERNDVVSHITAGGGGYGDPEDRSAEAIQADIREEKLSGETP